MDRLTRNHFFRPRSPQVLKTTCFCRPGMLLIYSHLEREGIIAR